MPYIGQNRSDCFLKTANNDFPAYNEALNTDRFAVLPKPKTN